MSTHQPSHQSAPRGTHGYMPARHVVLSMAKLLMLGFLPLLRAAPQFKSPFHVLAEDEEPPMSPDKPTLWIYLAVAIALVLLGGAFAGLTIALMGQVSYDALPGWTEGDQQLIQYRMKYTYRSSRRLAKDPRGTMPQRCYACSRGGNIGFS